MGRLLKPVNALTQGAQRIAGGDFDHAIATEGANELQYLATQFNSMAVAIRESYTALEQRVAERTKELSDTNTLLETEIVERRRAEDELQDAIQSLHALIQASPLPIVSADLDINIQIWNPAAERVFGWSEHEVLGRPLPLVPEDGQEQFRVYWEQLLQGKVVPGLEMTRQRKNGSLVDVGIWPAPLRDSNGAVGGVIAVIVDLTERQHAEETRRELAVAEERNRLAREIHDTLAQSLIGIMIQLETADNLHVREPDAASAELRSARDLARRSLEEARRSVWDLQSPRREYIDLTGAIRQEATSTAEDTVHLSLEVEGTAPRSMDPRNELAALRITQEALSNVRRHSNAKRAKVRLSYGASELRVLISDNGVGFEPSEVKGMLSPTSGGFGLSACRSAHAWPAAAWKSAAPPEPVPRSTPGFPTRWDRKGLLSNRILCPVTSTLRPESRAKSGSSW